MKPHIHEEAGTAQDGDPEFMSHARPDYTIIIACLGVLLAIGIPSLKRGQFIAGGLCIALAAVIVGWSVLAVIRTRR